MRYQFSKRWHFLSNCILLAIFLFWGSDVYAYYHNFDYAFDKSNGFVATSVIYGGSEEDKSRYTGMVCGSDTSPTFGACDTNPGAFGEKAEPGQTPLKLTFTEQRSGALAVVNLNLYRRYVSEASSSQCSSDGMDTKINVIGDCSLDSGDTKYYLSLADAASALPYGGIWTATLQLHQYKFVQRKLVWIQWDTLFLRIKMTDVKNMQMYLPNMSSAKPTVDLRLVASPFAKPDATESGDATIESCLYDGYNSDSTKFTLTAINPDANDGDFFVTARNPGNLGAGDRSKITYQVFASSPGDPSAPELPLASGAAHDFTVSPGAQVRQVALPGVTGPVVCVPWSLHLHTPAFKQKDKQAGYYDGKLKVLFSPSTNQAP
ncbi:CfaE/CblD family pilus tip adhesin [Robbsia sp. Bb-Pol-6]|uniref:CfaE/CblD family pilus tip adhesin n=1 Tax=Robbsia betulipollinis TaxID=2981849 RepID=A0ABT3ZL43_9BURK|nr:CfaE/CblD family pilus tip adhesin [Robbsia betulipollinis]MCY0387241.1 CfaE/CblD family pilus tip adhesin [Robbsia betulipollinis]